MPTPIRESGSTTPPQYSPIEEANNTALPLGSSSRSRQREGSGLLAGLQQRSTARRNETEFAAEQEINEINLATTYAQLREASPRHMPRQLFRQAGVYPMAHPISQVRDTRTSEEITRTANLHRRGQRRGLDDLPAMRQSLGQIAGTEEQRLRAGTFATRLENVEGALRQEHWDAVRSDANSIMDDAMADYEADRIIGVDYNSISEQLSIVFRRVPDPSNTVRD